MQTDWKTAREHSERFPCPYVAPTRQTSHSPRSRRDDDRDRGACGAGVGETCRVPGTDSPLRGQAAHLPRLRLAGVDAPPCFSAAVV